MADNKSKVDTRPRKNKICSERTIKVNQTYYEYRTKDQSPNSAYRSVPWIQMKGHWLKAAGFEIDTPARIRVINGCLC